MTQLRLSTGLKSKTAHDTSAVVSHKTDVPHNPDCLSQFTPHQSEVSHSLPSLQDTLLSQIINCISLTPLWHLLTSGSMPSSPPVHPLVNKLRHSAILSQQQVLLGPHAVSPHTLNFVPNTDLHRLPTTHSCQHCSAELKTS